MKELYTSPELELLCLKADARLAGGVDFDDLMGDEDWLGGGTQESGLDLDVGI